MHPKRTRACARGGFTHVELLVCIAIIATLAALILPALQSSRGDYRSSMCLNNLRNLGIAAQSYATAQNGQLPYLINRDQPINWGTTEAPLNAASPWPVHLMPYLELGPLAEHLLSSSNSHGTAADFRIDNLAAVSVKVFNCNHDPNEDFEGNLSYAINTGYIGSETYGKDVAYTYDPVAFRGLKPARGHSTVNYDYQFNAGFTELDAEIARSTGVAWPDSPVTIDEIARSDGATTTLLFVENLQTQRWAGRAPVIDLTGTPTIEYEISDSSFGVPVNAKSDAAPYLVSDRISHPANGVGDPTADSSASKSLVLDPKFTSVLTGSLRDGRINTNLDSATEGQRPRPSSNHPRGINVVFVGGNGKFLSEQIDPSLYAQLLSWDGTGKGQATIAPTAF